MEWVAEESERLGQGFHHFPCEEIHAENQSDGGMLPPGCNCACGANLASCNSVDQQNVRRRGFSDQSLIMITGLCRDLCISFRQIWSYKAFALKMCTRLKSGVSLLERVSSALQPTLGFSGSNVFKLSQTTSSRCFSASAPAAPPSYGLIEVREYTIIPAGLASYHELTAKTAELRKSLLPFLG